MWLAFLFCLFSLVSSLNRECGVTPELESESYESTKENIYHGRYLAYSRGITLAPIRFHFHYATSETMTQAQQDELKNFLIPTMNTYFSKTIRVYPLTQNLVFGKTSTYCYDFAIPAEHKTTGVSADILVYLTAYNAEESTIAWATSCYSEPSPTYNVLAGRVNINMYHFGDGEPLDSKLATLYHEVFHLLGFSNNAFRYYHKANNVPYATDEVTEIITIRDKQATVLKLPTVLSLARSAFGCDTLRGVELEDQGGSGTKGSHWDKLIMFNDFMTPDSGVEDYVFSDITFAVLHDSGWYDIDFTQTDKIVWGKGLGCGFFNNRCIIKDTPSSSLYCARKSQKGCTYTRIDKGYCNIATYSSSFPTYYAHFSTSTLGGTDTNMDYCPRFDNYSNGNCRGNGYMATSISVARGEEVCPNCRCFNTTLLGSRYVASTTISQGCYKVRCDKATSKYYITVGSTEKECIAGTSISFVDYSGTLACPPYTETCMDVPCIGFCLHRGKCVNSLCQCNAGYGGDYCQITCHITCKNCSGTANYQCTACRDLEVLGADNTCQCQIGSERNDSIGLCETSCTGLCLGCISGQGEVCTSCIINASLTQTSTVNGVIQGSCACNSGFSQNERNCIKDCNELCTTCLGPTGCSACKENSSISATDKWQCECNWGYKIEGNSCVKACDGLCLTCDLTNSAVCLSCVTNAILPEGRSSGTCSCKTGFQTNNDKCQASCNDLCVSCNPSTGCTQCNPNALVSSSNPSICVCKPGFQSSYSNCTAICIGLCLTCDTNNGSLCKTCAENAILPTGFSSGSCSCKAGYKNQNNICSISCNELCQTCTNTGCEVCKANSKLINGNPSECECTSGYHNVNGKCVAICVGLCGTCNEIIGTICITCKSNASFSNGNCTCKSGFIFDSGSYSCKAQCNDLCVICDNSRGCTSCTANSSLANPATNPSICSCFTGFYQKNTSCIASCKNTCLSCSSSDGNLCYSCKSNARIDPIGASSGSCVCLAGYVINSTTGECETWRCPTECSTCIRGSHTCKTCNSGYSYWPEVTGCYANCPSNYLNTNNQCTAVSESLFDFSLNQYVMSYRSKSYSLTGQKVKSVWSRGWYFSTNAYASLLEPVILAPNHYITLWTKLDTSSNTRTLLSKYADRSYYKLTLSSTNLLQLAINKEAYDDSYTNSQSTIDLGTLTVGSWHHLSIIFTFTSPNTIIKFYNREELLKTLTLSSAFYRDFSGSPSYLTMGAHYTGVVYTEHILGFIAGFKAANTASYMPSNTESDRVTSGFCLLNCSLTQYFDTACKDCGSTCIEGCIRGTDCRLNEDPLCLSFENYKGCSACLGLAVLKDEKCECVENAGFRTSTSSCGCNTGFKESNGRCLTCLNYYKTSEVTANFSSDYLKVLVNFSRAAKVTIDSQCSTIISSDSLAKLGTSPICVWNTARTVYTITLGQSPTISIEPLFLKDLVVLASGLDCSFINESLSPRVQSIYSVPSPTVFISGPTSLSLFCKFDLTYTLTSITGGMNRPVLYIWSFKESVNSDLDSYIHSLSKSSVTIPYSYFKEGSYTIILTATNFLGKSGSASITLDVQTNKAYTVVIDAGNEVSMKASDKRSFVASLSNYCGNSVSYAISWSFVESKQINFESKTVLNSSSQDHVLLVNENALSAEFSYTFRADAEDSDGNRGFTTLVIHATTADLVVILDKVDGKVSSANNLIINASKSNDPTNNSAKLVFKWTCSTGSTHCLDKNGNTLIGIETASDLTISSSKLKSGSSYTFTVTVSISDGRSASKSVKLDIIEAPSCTISIRNLKTKYNPQVDFAFPMTVKCPSGTTYSFTQTAGSTVTNKGSKLVAALFISANSMIEGESLSFEFSAIYNSMIIGTSQISWLVNTGPTSGSFSCTPEIGVHLKTLFTLSALDFQDGDGQDVPLKYTFFIQNKNGTILNISSSGSSNSLKVTLSQNTSKVGVKVCDSLSTCRSYSSDITVSRSRMLQDYSFLSMYLEYIRDPEMIPTYTILFTQEILDYTTYSTIKNSFIEYMLSKDDYTSDTRRTGYAGYIGLLSQETVLTSGDMIEMIQYIRDSLKHAEDKISDEEIYEIMDGLVPIANKYIQKPELFSQISCLLEDSMSLSRQELSPILLNEYGQTDRKYYFERVQASELNNYSQIVDYVKVIFSDDAIDSTKVVDLSVVVYNQENTSIPIVQVSMRDSGIVEDSNFKVNSSRNQIYKLNSEKKFIIELLIDRYREVDLENGIQCWVMQYDKTDYEELCTVIYKYENMIVIESSVIGLFKVSPSVEEDNEEPTQPSEDIEDEIRKDCEVNLAPSIMLVIMVGIFNILLAVVLLIKSKDSSASMKIAIDPVDKTAILSRVDNLNSSGVKDNPEGQLNTSSQKVDTETISPSVVVHPTESFVYLFLSNQLTLKIFLSESKKLRVYFLVTLLAICLFEFAVLGALYNGFESPREGSEILERDELVDEYNGTDFLYCLLTLAISMPCSGMLQCITRFENMCICFCMALGVIAGSIAGIIYMSVMYCHQDAGLWTMGTMLALVMEFILCQNIIALCTAIAFTIRNKVRQ